MIPVDDLEIFILTRNRACLLSQTIESFLQQTVKGFPIHVLDSGSTDETAQVVTALHDQNIYWHPAETPIESLANFHRAQTLASKLWVMVFHDDDLVHPAYIETALKVLSQYPDAVMIASAYIETPEPRPIWSSLSNNHVICQTRSEFAACLINGFPHNYASTIYRREPFQSTQVAFDQYGKICDRPFLMDISQYGTTIILTEPYIQYRVHPGQDTRTATTGPYLPEILNLLKYYQNALGTNPFQKTGLVYSCRIYKMIKIFYRAYLAPSPLYQNLSFRQFLQTCKTENLIPGWYWLFYMLDKIFGLTKHLDVVKVETTGSK